MKFKNCILMENGLNLKKFLNINKKIITGKLLYFGRLDKNKGLDLFFHTLAKVQFKNWSLDIIGDGLKDYKLELKGMTRILNITKQVKWHGFVDDEELLKNLEEAHICFFPSRYEGFGLTLVEAMASKNVCIANDIESFRNIIGTSKIAYLVDFSDFAESSHLIDSLLSGGFDLLEKISSEARENAKRFSWSLKIFEIINLYKNALS